MFGQVDADRTGTGAATRLHGGWGVAQQHCFQEEVSFVAGS